MDFRVYQVKDPRKFFTGLKDPHQMGKDEEEEIVSALPKRKSFLEKVRGSNAGQTPESKPLSALNSVATRVRHSTTSFARNLILYARL